MEQIRQINFVTTDRGKGPRGDYFDWCKLLYNGTLAFGDEQGNYAGGTTLSYRWYGNPRPNRILPVDTPITENYISEVKSTLEYCKIKNPSFYQRIKYMCESNGQEIVDRFFDPQEKEGKEKMKYRTKIENPIVVDAYLYTGNVSVPVLDEDFDEKVHAPSWIALAFSSGKLHCENPEDKEKKQLYLNTADGDVLVPVNSYIIRAEDGEIFCLKDVYFNDVYVPVPPEVDHEQRRRELDEAVNPLHEWLCKYGDPYTTVAVMQDRATVHQEYMTTPLPVPD